VTHRLDVVYIHAQLFINNHLMHDKVIVRSRVCVPIYSNCDYVNLQHDSVTLTFEAGTWFLDATDCLDVVFQVISKSLNVWQSPDTNERTDRRCNYLMPPFGGIKKSGRVHVYEYYPNQLPTAFGKYLSVRSSVNQFIIIMNSSLLERIRAICSTLRMLL
jgi:hypothetical protein